MEAVIIPSIRSVMSKMVAARDQGKQPRVIVSADRSFISSTIYSKEYIQLYMYIDFGIKMHMCRSIVFSLFLPGALFAFVASSEVLASAVATAFYPNVYPLTLSHGLRPGTAYLIMATLCILPVPLLMSVTHTVYIIINPHAHAQ